MKSPDKQIQLQNTPDILDPAQKTGVKGQIAELVSHLLTRAAHLGRTGDVVVVHQSLPDDYVEYLQSVTGQSPTYHRVSLPSEGYKTADMLAGLEDVAEDRSINPYIQSESIARFSRIHGIPMTYTPAEKILQTGVVDKANDKAYFRQKASELNIPLTPYQQTIPSHDIQAIQEYVEYMTANFNGAFIQATKSGGGVGNVEICLTPKGLNSKLGNNSQEIQNNLVQWAREMKESGSEEVVVQPYLDIMASHTVSGFIPEEVAGEPFDYGVFWQDLAPGSNDYQGFEWPATDSHARQYETQMRIGAQNWFRHLQKLGYVGPSDVDYMIGKNSKIGEILIASESNTRWDGFRFVTGYAGEQQSAHPRTLQGINPEGGTFVKAYDHHNTSATSTREFIDRLRQANIPVLGITNRSEGAILVLPPRRKRESYEAGIGVLATDQNRLQEIYSAVSNATK